MKTKILIIGAGPYGIGIANTLWEKGIPFEITGYPLSLWYYHTLDSMAIRSDWHTSEIYSPSKKYDFRAFLEQEYSEKAEDILKDRVPIDVFRNYLNHVEKSLPYEIIREEVTRLKKKGRHFFAETEHLRQIQANAVILATGIGKHLFLPDCLIKLPEEQVLHAWDTEKITEVKDSRLLVVGAGQSAAESIAQLKHTNSITWIARSKPIFYSEPINLPVPIFNFALKVSPYFYYLPEPLRQKFGKKYVISTITPDLEDAVMSSDIQRIYGSVEELQLEKRDEGIYSLQLEKSFDMVIAATGYRYNLNNLDFIDYDLSSTIEARNQIPKLDFNFQTSVPGLYVVGGMAEPAYGPAQRFMMGSRHAAERIGKVALTL